MNTATRDSTRTPISAIVAIIAISAVASLFLCWLVYYHAPADVAGTQLLFLPALNALLNGLSAIALVIGFFFIRAKRISEHRAAMFIAFIFSTLFLVTYITNHALHGDMHFQGQVSVPEKESGRVGSQPPLRFDGIGALTAKLRNIFRGVRFESS